MLYTITFKTKWADFDANRHLRHSAYNDYAAECRVRFLRENGFGVERFAKDNMGPILFKEETSFFREVNFGDDITIELYLEGMSRDGSRFKLFHKIYREDGVLAAEVKIFGAWLDLAKRKLTIPASDLVNTFNNLAKADSYEDIFLKDTSKA